MIASRSEPFATTCPVGVCPCYAVSVEFCACPANEAGLRTYSEGLAQAPMTPEQREWCLDEIGAVEGYTRADHEAEDDAQLARTVLGAWTDYCRDKGLL